MRYLREWTWERILPVMRYLVHGPVADQIADSGVYAACGSSQVGSDLRGVVVGILVRGAVIGVGLFSSPTWFCKAAARMGR